MVEPDIHLQELEQLRGMWYEESKSVSNRSMQANASARSRQAKNRFSLKFRRVLTENDVKRIHYYRHGTLAPSDEVKMSYLQIGKKLHLSPSTCFTALVRYKQNGNRFVNKRLTNWSKAWTKNRKIKGADKEFLLSRATLQRWAGYSLVKRC